MATVSKTNCKFSRKVLKFEWDTINNLSKTFCTLNVWRQVTDQFDYDKSLTSFQNADRTRYRERTTVLAIVEIWFFEWKELWPKCHFPYRSKNGKENGCGWLSERNEQEDRNLPLLGLFLLHDDLHVFNSGRSCKFQGQSRGEVKWRSVSVCWTQNSECSWICALREGW